MDEFLKEQGYQLYKDNKDVRAGDAVDLFQKKYVIHERKFFINIVRTDMSPIYSREHILLDPIAYEIETAFELSDGKWTRIRFYTFTEKLLRAKLDEYERKILCLWTLLEGKGES